MTVPSPRAKKAIKTGLAMTIVYGLAMRMGWATPHWAAMSVGMISLVTVGQSLNKATLRVAGTLVSATLAFIYLSLFVQDRWAMLAILTVHIGVCSYMITGKRGSYGWFVCGYVCLIISVGGHGSSDQIFHTAMARTGETVMGIMVYTLVSVFLWPQRSQGGMEEAASKLFSTQVTLYQGCRSLLTGAGKSADTGSLLTREAQLLTQFELALDAATTDSYEVWEVREQWHRFSGESHDLMETLERLRTGFPELQHLALPQFLPNLNALCAELDMRFAQIERMLALNKPDFKPQTIALEIDKETLHALSSLEKAALAVSKSELDRVELLSRSLFNTVADIRGFARQGAKPNMAKQPTSWLAIDPERVIVALRAVMTLWISFLIWFYVNPPGGASFAQISVTIALIAVKMPTTPPRALFVPYTTGVLFSGVLYLYVMPHLSCYWQMGALIFTYFFVVNYLFWKPQQGLALVGATIAFVNFTFVENEMVYNFSKWADSLVVLTLGILLTIACTYIPASPRPEKIFLRLTNRFFKHCEFLISRIDPDLSKKSGLMEQWKTALYSNNLAQLPVKLGTWGAKIDPQSFPCNTPEQVQALVTALHELALRVKAVTDAREHPQAAYFANKLREDVRAWRVLIEKECRLWAENPDAAIVLSVDMPDRLAKQLTILETRSKEVFALKEKEALTPEDYENFYRLLGSYRGLSESGIKFTQSAGKIDWAHWQEARF